MTNVTDKYVCAHQLGTNESKDYGFDVTPEITTGSSVGTVVWEFTPDDGQIVVDRPTTSGNIVSIWISTPKARTAYTVRANVQTSLSKKLEYVMLIGGTDKGDVDAASNVGTVP